MNLAEILVDQAKIQPEAIALIHKERKITYGELNVITDKLAAGLQTLNIKKGERVALIAPNIPEFITGFFSVLKAGATVIPVNFLFKSEELKYVLAHSEASAVIIAAPFLPLLMAVRAELHCLEKIIVFGAEPQEGLISYEKLIKEGSAESLLCPTEDDDTAVILYTSGTTGRLKGAMLSHHNIYFDTKAAKEVSYRTSSDCFLVVIPLFHSFGMTACMMLGILCGAKLVL